MDDLEISPKFTIDDIHKIRYADYELTKNMTTQEKIEHTRRAAQPALERLAQLRAEKGDEVAAL